MTTNCGVLRLVKNGDNHPAFNFTTNETCTVGTQPKCNIRLKVQTSVPECSIFKTDSRGYTEFLSNGVSNCQINNKPFKGVKYLIPGDVLHLFGKKFIYLNSNLSEDVIELLRRENRKMFCKEKLKDKMNTKRHTMFIRKNIGKSSTSIRGSRTPGPKCMYNIYANEFMVEDIENHPITPSKTSSKEIVQHKRFKNIFNTPQYCKTTDDNHFSFVQYQEINVQIGGSSNSSDTPKRKNKFSLNSISDQPPDLIPIEQIANSAEDVTMINDVSDPFSEVTPETGLELHSNYSSPVRTRELMSPQKQEDKIAKRRSDCCDDEMNNFDESLNLSSNKIEDSTKKTRTSVLNKYIEEVVDSPSDVEQDSPKLSIKTGIKTPKSASKQRNDSSIIQATPAYVRGNTRASMTPDSKQMNFSITAGGQSPKMLSSGKKILNESTNTIAQREESNNSINTSPCRNITTKSVFSAITPPRRYSERIIATRKHSERRRSEIINNTIQPENLQNSACQPIITDSPSSNRSTSSESLRKSSSGSSLTVLINDANITMRRSQKPGTATSFQQLQNTEDMLEEDTVLDKDDLLEKYSRGSSYSHYDSDGENITHEKCTKLSGIERLEKSVLESPSIINSQLLQESRNSTSSNTEETYHSLSDRQEEDHDDDEESEGFPSENSISHMDNNDNIDSIEYAASVPKRRGIKHSRSQMETPDTSGNRIKRRHPSANDLTDLEAIKDLLDISSDARPQIFNQSTHYESIKDLLDIPTQSEDLSIDGRASISPKNDFTQNKATKKSCMMPNSPENKEEGVISILRTPRPQNRISLTPKTPQKTHQTSIFTTLYKDTPRPKTPQQSTPILRRSLRTPKPRKSPGCDSPDHKDVKNLTRTPHPQKTPIRKSQISRRLSEVNVVKGILKTPTNQNQSVSEEKVIDSRTPKLRKSRVDNVSTFKTPKSQNKSLSDHSDVVDVKQKQETPKPRKTPKKSLKDVGGVKGAVTPKTKDQSQSDLTDAEEVMCTPKPQKPSINDLDNVGRVKNVKTSKTQNQPRNDLTDVKGVKQIMRTPKPLKSPKNDLSDMRGVKSILKTPKIQNQPNNDLTDVRGVKKLLSTPKVQKSPKNDLSNVTGIKSILKTPKVQNPPKNDLGDVKGVKKLMATPKTQNPPRNDLSDLRGVKTLMRTPGTHKEPNNDLSDVKGVKKLMATPKNQKAPKNDLSDIKGVKKLMATPKTQKQPQNDLSDVRGVKKLMSTPKVQREPTNDLTDVRGVKTLLKSPKIQNQPKNDLSNVKGVKKLMSTPKPQKLPKNDLSDVTGVKKMMMTPKPPQKSPKNDLSNVEGVKSLFTAQKQQKLPKNDLTNVHGVKDLFKILEDNNTPEVDYEGLKELFQNDNSLELENDDRDPFDKLIDKKSYRTYKGKSVSPKGKGLDTLNHDVAPSILEWVQDQSKRLENIEKVEPVKVSKAKSTRSNARNKRKLEKESETETSTAEEVPQRPVRRTRRNAHASNSNEQEENAPVAMPSTRSRGKARKSIESEVDDAVSLRSTRSRGKVRKSIESEVDDAVSIRSTRSRGKKRKEEIETSVDNDETAVVKITRGKNKKKSEELSSLVEVNLTVPKTRNGGRLKKLDNEIEEIFKTPNKIKHDTSTPLKTGDKNKRSDESEESPQKSIKRTRKLAKNTRAKKQAIVDESDELTGGETKIIDTSSSNQSLYEPEMDKSNAKGVSTRGTRTRGKTIQEVTPPKTRGGRSKQKKRDEDNTSNEKGTKSATKRMLYDPESESTALSVSKESAIEERPLKKGKTSSKRNVNLPRMLEEFEHDLNKNTKTENKAAPKTSRAKRKVAVEEIEPVGRVTRSKRAKM